MDPDANLQEQERLLRQRTRDAADRSRLAELRAALWGWLRGRGFEPRWSECPKAAVHFKSYGGSNVAGWSAALLLCLLLPAAAAAQVRTVYTDRDPATGALLERPVAVQVRTPVRQASADVLAGLKAREYVAPPEWPDGPQSYVLADPGPDWPFPPGTQERARFTALLGTGPGVSFRAYGPRGPYGYRGPYGPTIINARGRGRR